MDKSYSNNLFAISMFGEPSQTTGLVTAVTATLPIVSSGGTTPNISHQSIGTAGTYAYPSSVTTDAKGHVSAITAGSAPLTGVAVQDEGIAVVTTGTLNFTGVGVTVTDVAGVATVNVPGASSGPLWQPLTQGAYYGYDGSSVNTIGVGYNVHVDAAAEQSILIGQDGYLRANASLAVAIGDVADCGNEEDIAIGANATTGNDAGTRRTAIGSLVSITTSDSTTGVGSRLSCTTSANTCLYGASTTSSNSPTAAAFGKGITLTNATNAAVVGQGTSVTAVDSSGIGQGQTIANTNCVALGQGATTTTDDELCTGSQTTLRFPSIVPATAVSTSYPMLWDFGTNVCVPDSNSYFPGGTSFSPTFTNITVNNGTISCSYYVIGRVVIYRLRYTVGSSDSFTGAISVDLPISTSSTYARGLMCQVVSYRPASTYAYGVAIITGANTVTLMSNGGSNWTNTTPVTWTTSDVLAFNLVYEY